MTRTLVENVVKAINWELNNGLVYVEFTISGKTYITYTPINYDNDVIRFVDGCNNSVELVCKAIDEINIIEL